MLTVEFRIDISGIPHSFVVLDNGQGFREGYGFAPSEEHSLISPGQIYNDLDHPWDYTTGSIQVTVEQYNIVAAYINQSIQNPPNYNLPNSILFPNSVQQCAQWVMDLAQRGNIPVPFTMQRGGWNPYGQAGWIVISDILGTTPDPLVKVVKYVDPLILDLNGDGLKITPLSKGILFDTNGDTIKTGTAWASADDGFLVLDRNGNGQIDSGNELFGDETILTNGNKAANGFVALKELDSNSDNSFDANDSQYANLRIWQDLNQDGISQAGELKSLTEASVQSINLINTPTNTSYNDAQLVQSGNLPVSTGASVKWVVLFSRKTVSIARSRQLPLAMKLEFCLILKGVAGCVTCEKPLR